MKCSNCGAELSQNTSFCAACGTPVSQKPQGAAKKKNLVLIVTLVCAAVLLIGYIVALNTPMYDLPIISVAIDEDERDDMKDDMESMADQEDEIEDRLEALEDVYTNKEMKLAEKCVKATLAVAKNPSIGNLKNLSSVLEKADGTDLARDLDIDDMDEFTEAVGLLNGMLVGGLIFCLLFTVLGGLSKRKGLVIAGMIFSVFYTLPTAGVIFTILSIAAHIVLVKQIGAAKARA